MASDIKQVSGSFTGTGAGKQIPYANGIVSVYIAGTFTGTVQLQAQANQNAQGFAPVIPFGQTSPNITAPGLYLFPRFAGDFAFQLGCTAFTSGPIQYTLAVSP